MIVKTIVDPATAASPERAKRVHNATRRVRKLTVYMFNVGQGDHILLHLPNGEYGIIDCFYDTGLNLPEPPALTYFKVMKRMNPETPIVLSFVCISHPDGDHVKGVRELLDWVKNKDNGAQLKNLWLFPGTILEELLQLYREYVDTAVVGDTAARASEVSRELQSIFKFRDARSGKCHVEYLQDIRKLADNVGGGVKAVTLAPLGKHVKKFNKQAQRDFIRFTLEGKKQRSAQQNLISSILMLIYGSHRLLFGGDTGSEIWLDSIKQYKSNNHIKEYGPLKGSFVKASHHGSKHSSAPAIWECILSPRAQVGISAGRKRNYGHPHPETLKQIIANFKKETDGAEILATNSCHECVAQQALPKWNFDWIASGRPPLKWQVEESFDADRAEEAGSQSNDGSSRSTPEYLAAYVYQFRKGNAVTIYKGVSSRVTSDEECLFKTKDSLPFPLCALSSGK